MTSVYTGGDVESNRVGYILAMTVYTTRATIAYLAGDCVLVSSLAVRRHLRSADGHPETRRPANHTNASRRQELRSLLCSRLGLSVPADL